MESKCISKVLVVTLIAVVLLVPSPKPAFGLKTQIHSIITYEAAKLPGVPAEIISYIGDPDDNPVEDDHSDDDICEGSVDEDINRTAYPDDESLWNWGQHFWQPEGGPEGGLLGTFDHDWLNAYQRAQQLYNEAIAMHSGNPSGAYYILGKVAHLLEDMSTPAHVNLDEHLGEVFLGFPAKDDDSYEEYFLPYVTPPDPSGRLKFEGHYDKDISELVPVNTTSLSGDPANPDTTDLYRLFWSMGTLSRQYDSDDAEGTSDGGARQGKSVTLNTILAGKTVSGVWKFASDQSVTPEQISTDDYELSPVRNKLILSNSVLDAITPPYDYVAVFFAADFSDGEGHYVSDFDNNDLGDSSCEEISRDLICKAISHVAGLYTMFYDDATNYQPVVVDIKANGLDGPITLSQSNTLSVTITLDPGSYEWVKGDWSLEAWTPWGIYCYTLYEPWWNYFGVSISWEDALSLDVFMYHGPLCELGEYEVLLSNDLPPGNYYFTFRVDTNMNGPFGLFSDEEYSDMVQVIITE